jgi:hypothetical protein
MFVISQRGEPGSDQAAAAWTFVEVAFGEVVRRTETVASRPPEAAMWHEEVALSLPQPEEPDEVPASLPAPVVVLNVYDEVSRLHAEPVRCAEGR